MATFTFAVSANQSHLQLDTPTARYAFPYLSVTARAATNNAGAEEVVLSTNGQPIIAVPFAQTNLVGATWQLQFADLITTYMYYGGSGGGGGGPPTGPAGGDLTGTYPNPALIPTGVTAATYGDSTHVAQITVDLKGRVTNAADVLIASVAPTGPAGGDLTGTYPNPTLTTTAVTPGSYTVSSITVDAKGRITAASSGPSSFPPNGAAGGDLTGTYPNPTLTTTGVVGSTYGNSTQVGQFTVDAKGRLTSASNVTITGTVPGGPAGGDLAGTYPNPAIAVNAVQLTQFQQLPATTVVANPTGALANAQATTLDPTLEFIGFATLGRAALVGDVTAASGSNTTTLANTAVVAGSYTTTNLTVDAKGRITAAANGATSFPPNGAAGGDLTGTYPNPTLVATAVAAGSYTTTNLTVDAKGRITAASNGATSFPPNGAAGGDLTGTYPNPTLTTTGVAAATYGSATQVGQFTVDAKGRITSAANVTITTTTPSGPAGGDLTGTYPNPTVATNAVTYAKFQQMSASTILGNPTGALANASEITLNSTLSFTGTTLQRAALTGDVTASAGSNTTTLSNTAVAAGSYTTTNLTVDAKGRITAASNGATSFPPNGAAGGDLTGTYPNPTLVTSGVTAATYGSATQVGQFTVDAKGRLTFAQNVTVTGTAPGGAAGGDLTGTYPNPTVGTNKVTYAKFQQMAATTLLGNPTGALANASEITLNSTLSFTGTTLQRAALTGDVTASAGSNATTLANTAVTPGSYTSTNLTVDSKGRITAASNGSGGGTLTVGAPSTTSTANALDITGTVLTAHYGSSSTPGVIHGQTYTATGASDTNVSIGQLAMPNYSTQTGAFNIGIGKAALGVLTSGASNTCTGWSTGTSLITGGSNSFYGAGSGSLATGSNNSAFGTSAFTNGVANTGVSAFGFQALAGNFTGDNVCAFGYNAMGSTTRGDGCCAFGANALLNMNGSVTDGSGHTAIGFSSLTGLLTCPSQNIGLGYESGKNMTTASKCIVIGKTNGPTGNAVSCHYIGNGITATNGVSFECVWGDALTGQGANTYAVRLASVPVVANNALSINASGQITRNASSRFYKTITNESPDMVASLVGFTQLAPKLYTFIAEKGSKRQTLGYTAEDVAAINGLSQCVVYAVQPNGPHGNEIVPDSLDWQAINVIANAKIAQLEARLAVAESNMALLKAAFPALKLA